MSEQAADRVSRILASEAAEWGRQHLLEDMVGWLTTVAPDGRVQSSPVSFLWSGASVLIYSQPDMPKLRNIAAHPQVSFALNSDEYGNHSLIMEGTAEIAGDVEPWAANEAMSRKYRNAWPVWDLDEARTSKEFSVPIRIRPTRVRAW